MELLAFYPFTRVFTLRAWRNCIKISVNSGAVGTPGKHHFKNSITPDL